MQFFTDISEARRAIVDFVAAGVADLPAELAEEVKAAASSPSPVDQICNLAELLYARREEVSDAAKQLAAGLAAFAGDNGWHELREGRGRGIALAMMRDTDVAAPLGVAYPDAADDPAPSMRFVPAAG